MTDKPKRKRPVYRISYCGQTRIACSDFRKNGCPQTRRETPWIDDAEGRSRTVSGGVCIKSDYK
jgi:hypothetical protein